MTTLTRCWPPALVPGVPASLRPLWTRSRVLLALAALVRLLALALRAPHAPAPGPRPAPPPPAPRALSRVRPCRLVLF